MLFYLLHFLCVTFHLALAPILSLCVLNASQKTRQQKKISAELQTTLSRKTIQERALQLGAERKNEVSFTHTLFSGQWDTSKSKLEQANLSSLFMPPEEMRCEQICDGLQSFPVTALHVLLFYFLHYQFVFLRIEQFLFRELQKVSSKRGVDHLNNVVISCLSLLLARET